MEIGIGRVIFLLKEIQIKVMETFIFMEKEGLKVSLKVKMFIDAFPNDPNEFWDTDGDGTGDNADTDIDGDGLTNVYELTPREPKYSGCWIIVYIQNQTLIWLIQTLMVLMTN